MGGRPSSTRLAWLGQLRVWRPGLYARSSAVLFGWLLVRAAAQTLLVVLLARTLGARSYGVYVAALAVAGFFAPMAGLGLQGVILRDGSRAPETLGDLLDHALRLYWRALLASWLVGAAVALLALPRAIPALLLVLLVGTEIAAGSLIEILGRVEQALQRSAGFGALMAGLALVRLFALVAWEAAGTPTVGGWIFAYGAASLLYAAAVLWRARRRLRPTADRAAPDWAMAAQGRPFAVGAVALRVQSEFNKPVLAAIGPALAANLSLAQRAVDVASLPLVALQDALWSRLYASHEPGRRLLRTGGALLALALLGGVALTVLAPLLPQLLGHGFEATAQLLRWLAWLPSLQLLRNLGNAHLIATGHARRLTGVYVLGALLGMLATVLLVDRIGLEGAIAAAYATELVTLAAQSVLYFTITAHAARARP